MPKRRVIHLPVTIVIPVRNGEKFLRRAVKSALVQDPAEVIIVDNNSTDGTRQLIIKLMRGDDRVKGLKCKRQGASAARNLGLRRARSRWIQFLDADDELDEGKIERQIARAESTTQWIIGGYRNRFSDGTITENIPHDDPWKGLVHRYRIGCTHANLYRRRALLDIGGWREDLPDNQDTNLHFDLLKSGQLYQLQHAVRCTYHHHASPDRVGTGDPTGGNRRRTQLLERVNRHLRTNRPDYWRANSPYFRGALLRALRVYATHDLGAAAGAWEGFLKRGTDTAPPELISPLLWRSYRTLGFKRTESLRLALAPLLPAALKNRLK